MKSCLFPIAVATVALLYGCALEQPNTAVNNGKPGSSYACDPTRVAGSHTVGDGRFGCHFRLHDPATGRILANTPYTVALALPGNPATSLENIALHYEGVTDTNGRSTYVRSPLPITLERVYFVQRIGNGKYQRTPRLMHPINGLAMPNVQYMIDVCGQQYKGVSDERGNGAEYHSDNPACEIRAQFYKGASSPV